MEVSTLGREVVELLVSLDALWKETGYFDDKDKEKEIKELEEEIKEPINRRINQLNELRKKQISILESLKSKAILKSHSLSISISNYEVRKKTKKKKNKKN